MIKNAKYLPTRQVWLLANSFGSWLQTSVRPFWKGLIWCGCGYEEMIIYKMTNPPAYVIDFISLSSLYVLLLQVIVPVCFFLTEMFGHSEMYVLLLVFLILCNAASAFLFYSTIQSSSVFSWCYASFHMVQLGELNSKGDLFWNVSYWHECLVCQSL